MNSGREIRENGANIKKVYNMENTKKEFDKCINGCIVDGKKLTGENYFYLNYIKINGKFPKYRSKDKAFFDQISKK